jgi:two-component system sensor histidine kinase RegB
MHKHTLLTLAAPTQHLRQLSIIRSLLLVLLGSGYVFANIFLMVHSSAIISMLLILSVINLLTILRLKNPLEITETEFFIQLIIDIVGLLCLFYLSGGANNPFISYLLVPICISAATLPWRYTWFITGLSLFGYSLLLFFYIHFPLFAINHEHQQSPFNWHIAGMWFNFFISATLITYFVVKMAQSLRQQEKALSEMREDELRNEQLMAVAMLAAGTAHEINTPLCTMTLILSELRDEHKDNAQLLPDLELLSQQVNHCAARLKQLVNESSNATQGQFKTQTVQACCETIIDRWQLLRPNVQRHIEFSGDALEKTIALDPRLEQAVMNILNNAADASPQDVDIKIHAQNDKLIWKISDCGSGLESHLTEKIGKTTVTNKALGLGLGMVLTHATVKKAGGNIQQFANDPTGTITELTLLI